MKNIFDPITRSSSETRKQIRDEFVLVPDVLSNVPIIRYYELLESYIISLKHSDNQYLIDRYINLSKICVLSIEKLPYHPSYNLPENNKLKKWCNDVRKICINELELIVTEIDKLDEKSEITHLIDEFDGDESDSMTNSDNIVDFQKHESKSWSEALKILSSKENNIPQIKNLETLNSTCHDTSTEIRDEMKISDEVLMIIKSLSLTNFYKPRPYIKHLKLKLGYGYTNFHQIDFHTSFTPFMKDIPQNFQICRSVLESNRCFFLHLGVAFNFHPFILEIFFRKFVSIYLRRGENSEIASIVLPTVLEYAGFVDANSLMYIWPNEFYNHKICVISGSTENPIFSCFATKEKHVANDVNEVIIYCDGNHFTLLQTQTPELNLNSCDYYIPPGTINNILASALAVNSVVNLINVETDLNEFSILKEFNDS